MLDALHGLTKTGEGYGRPGGDSSLPIDINYAKLVEWLVCICTQADRFNTGLQRSAQQYPKTVA